MVVKAVYPHSYSELEHPCDSNKLSLLCRGRNWQWLCFSDNLQSHYCISDKMCVFLDKAVAISEILNVWMTNGLVDQAWSAGEYLIHNL
jgi:hypothetical protein